jgi:serine/threonine-protein kinase mTOR
LRYLGYWNELLSFSQFTMENYYFKENIYEIKKMISHYGMTSSFNLQDWDSLYYFVDKYPDEKNSTFWYAKSILHIVNNEYKSALESIQKSREYFTKNYLSLLLEGSYKQFIDIQLLSELEEIIEYRTTKDSELKDLLTKKWNKRLNGVEKTIKYQERFLLIRTLAISPSENIDQHLKFASLCRDSKDLNTSLNTLKRLVKIEDMDYKKSPMEYIKKVIEKDTKVGKK